MFHLLAIILAQPVTTPVHTTGVNWDSIGVIAGVVVAVATYVTQRFSAGKEKIDHTIKTSIAAAAELQAAKSEVTNTRVEAKLDLIGEHLNRQDATLADHQQRIEHALARTEAVEHKVDALSAKVTALDVSRRNTGAT